MRPDIKAAIDRYAEEGYAVGHFLTAVLSNDLCQAVGRADLDNIRDLREIVQYCNMEIPGSCWGSPKAVKDWIEKHRIRREAAAKEREG